MHPHALLASPPLPPSTPPSHASGRAAASSPSAGPCASLRTERRVVMALAVASFVLALPASLVFIGAPWCPLAFAQSGQVLPVCASCAVTPLPWWAALLAVVAGVALIVDIIAGACVRCCAHACSLALTCAV